MLHLKSYVLLHPFFLIKLPLCNHVEEGARGHRDGHSILGFGLEGGRKGQERDRGREGEKKIDEQEILDLLSHHCLTVVTQHVKLL